MKLTSSRPNLSNQRWYTLDSEQSINTDEVLQPSSLAGFIWPMTDPLIVDQPVREKSIIDSETIRIAATNVNIDWDMFEKNHRNQSLPQKVFELITNPKFQFNTRTKILQEKRWLERITLSVSKCEPITIVYPLFCKIGNWAKQMTNIGPNAGDEATLLFFGHLNALVKKIYPPGLKFIIVTDAQLYNSAFQNTEVEVATYINECRQMIINTNSNSFISFINYVDLLSEFSTDYLTLHNSYHKKLRSDSENILKGIHVKTLFDSVKASINTRQFNMDYYDHKDIFSKTPNINNMHYKIIDEMARVSFEEVLCIRLACGDLNIFDSIFPNNIRVTCHKGLKNGIAVIGLRPYPEYYGSSKLLPYHGVPIITNSKNKLKLDILPEIMLRGRLDLTRVVNEKGQTYYYDSINNKF